MKKRIKSALCALLSPFALASAAVDSNKLGFGWEFSYDDGNFSSQNQLEFRSSDFFVAGSVSSQSDGLPSTVGLTAKAKSVGKTFGDFKSRKNKSYFDGTRRTRNETFYAGINLHRHDGLENEYFTGVKFKRISINTSKDLDDKFESEAYIDLPKGRTLGFANEIHDNTTTTGAFYKKGDLTYQLNFNKDNFGYKLSLSDVLSKTGDNLLDASERLDVEVGHGISTGGTFSLNYNVNLKEGIFRKINFGLIYESGGIMQENGIPREVRSEGAVIENRLRLWNEGNLLLRHGKKTDIGYEIKY